MNPHSTIIHHNYESVKVTLSWPFLADILNVKMCQLSGLQKWLILVKTQAQVNAKYKTKVTKFPECLAIPLEDVASIEDEDLEVYHVGT